MYMMQTQDTFQSIMLEIFSETDSILAEDKFYNYLNEAETLSLADDVSYKMLKTSEDKLVYLLKKGTYGDIPKTKGDFSKSEYYMLCKSIFQMLDNIYINGNGSSVVIAKDILNELKYAVQALEHNSTYFMKGYLNKDSNIMLTYMNYAGSVVKITSILFINTVIFDDECNLTFNVRLNPRVLNKNKLIKQLREYNKLSRNKKLSSMSKFNEKMEAFPEDYPESYLALKSEENIFNEGFRDILGDTKKVRNEKNITSRRDKFKKIFRTKYTDPNTGKTKTSLKAPGVVGAIILGAGAIVGAIYLSRFCISLFYYFKNTCARDAEYLSTAVEANAIKNEYDSTKSGKVAEKQRKLAKKLREVGKSLDTDYKQAEMKASVDIEKSNKDISDSVEDSILAQSGNNDLEASNNSNLDTSSDLFI